MKPKTKSQSNISFHKFTGSKSKMKNEVSIDSVKHHHHTNKNMSMVSVNSTSEKAKRHYSNPFRQTIAPYNESEQRRKAKRLLFELQDFIQDLRKLISRINREYQRMIDNTMGKLRKEFQFFIEENYMKKSPLTTNLSEQSSATVTQTKNFDLLKKEEEKIKNFKNPIKLKNSILESANVNQVHFSNKNSFQIDRKIQQRSQRTSSMREPQQRDRNEASRSPASKQMMKLNEKLASLKNMLNS